MPKRQNISIGGIAANDRIEEAIPRFMSSFGMARDQATAVAIRLESLGRLQDGGGVVEKTTPRGEPFKGPRGPALMALTAIATGGPNQKESVSFQDNVESDSFDDFRDQLERPSRATKIPSRLRNTKRKRS